MTGGDEPLTAEEAAQVLDALDEGDTGVLDDEGAQEGSDAPDAAADDAGSGGEDADAPHDGEEQSEPKADKEGATEGDGTDAVVLARDGKHTIPYEKLQEARQGWQQASAQVQALQQQLDALKAQQQGAPQGEPAAQDEEESDGDDDEIFGDFSEEALKAGIEKLVQQRVAAASAPYTAREQQSAQAAHEQAIYAKHPNADSIVQSKEFAAWVNAHPAPARAALWNTFDVKTGGSAAEVIEVLDAYAQSSGKQQSPTTTPSAARSAAKSAIARTQAEPPSSLSSIPGGRVDGRDLFARMDEMSGEELYAATENMTSEQMEQWLARAI